MNIFLQIIKYLWFFILIAFIFGAIYYFVRSIKNTHSDEPSLLTGKFYSSNDNSFSLFLTKKQWKTVLMLCATFIIVRFSTMLISEVIKALYFDGYNLTFSGFFKDFIRWDSNHYLGIAQNGYQSEGDPRFHIVFYPMFPWITKIFSYITGSVPVAGYIVSNLCFMVTIAAIYKLLIIDFSESAVINTILLMIFHPFAFFYSLPFTESTFVMFLVLFMLCLRREKWIAAGIMGFMCTLTRNFGLLLIIPFGVWAILVAVKRKQNFGKFILHILPGILIFAAFGVYLYINKVVTGDWFTFLVYQKEHWSNEISCIWKNVFEQYNRFFVTYASDWTFKYYLWLPQIISTIIIFISMFIGRKKVPFLYNIYSLAHVFLTLTVSWPLSATRYITAAFTMYIPFGMNMRYKKWPFYTALAACYILGIFVIFGYITGMPVM